MSIQTINLGTYANDGTGDDLRTAFTKVNDNFDYLSNLTASDGANLGAGSPVFAGKSDGALQFRSISGSTNITVTSNGTTITVSTPSTITANVTGNVTGNTTGIHTGTVVGNVTGNTTGIHTGNVTGNVTGTVSRIDNHYLSSLLDVAETAPTQGQALIFSSGRRRPGTVTTTGGGGDGLDFGSFTSPAGFTLDLGSF